MTCASHLWADRRGTSVLEFALTLPLLILLFAGGFQLNDAVAAYRKLTVSTRTLADLTSQYTTVDTARVNTILSASGLTMAPYSTTGMTMTISQIKIDDKGVATVDWSQTQSGTALTPNDPFELPAALRQPSTYLLVARMTYKYSPIFSSSLLGNIQMGETIFMAPRAANRVNKQ